LENVKSTSVPWRTEWNKEYHMYQRIRGEPAVIMRKDTPTIRDDFMQKEGNLIEPINFIGSKILKISKTDRSRSSIGGNGEVGTSFSSFSPGGENMSGTKFEVSFDGDFTRNCEFIVTLPILEKDSRRSSGESHFRPKRGCGESGESSEEKGIKPKGEKASFERFFNNQEDLDDETSLDSEGETGIPSPQRKAAEAWRAAGVWELRALRAEENLKRYKEGLCERSDGTKLDVTLSTILNTDSGVMDERNIEKESNIGDWHSRAFDTMPGDVWMVLKVPQGNRTHVMCDLCNGDEPDDKQWLEGPFSQNLTLREMLEYQKGTTKKKRRACTDNLLRKAHARRVKSPITSSGKSSSSAAPLCTDDEMRREEILSKQRMELQHYNDRRVESAVKPSRKDLRHAKRRGKEASKESVNLTSNEMIGTSDEVRSFRGKVKPYRPVDLLAGEKKRKRN
jgi:hypothetical protein